jgi:hypothetical protein
MSMNLIYVITSGKVKVIPELPKAAEWWLLVTANEEDAKNQAAMKWRLSSRRFLSEISFRNPVLTARRARQSPGSLLI